MYRFRTFAPTGLAIALITGGSAIAAHAQQATGALVNQSGTNTSMGSPSAGNRGKLVVGVDDVQLGSKPGGNVIYTTTAGGGVWKSTSAQPEGMAAAKPRAAASSSGFDEVITGSQSASHVK